MPSKFRGKVNKTSRYKFNNDDEFFNQLKFIVLNQLKGKQMIKNGKIILKSKSFFLLKRKYGMSSFFKPDFCEITEFYGRIHQPRKFIFLESQIYSAPFFSFKYLKSNEVL